jgi:hypothetical protein
LLLNSVVDHMEHLDLVARDIMPHLAGAVRT